MCHRCRQRQLIFVATVVLSTGLSAFFWLQKQPRHNWCLCTNRPIRWFLSVLHFLCNQKGFPKCFPELFWKVSQSSFRLYNPHCVCFPFWLANGCLDK